MPIQYVSRKKWLLASILLLLVFLFLVFRPLYHILVVKSADRETLPPLEKGYADDVSRLNKTAVHSIVKIASHKDTAIQQLRNIFSFARDNNLPVSIAGARHSMGGHTIAPDGIVRHAAL
jgi:hypothetical protein